MKRILISCDYKDVLDSLKTFLEQEGYEVDTVLDGEKCIEALKKTPVDLLLLDYFMEPMNGIHILERVRRDKQTAKTKVILTTAASIEDIGAENLKRLKAKYVQKPFDLEKFKAEIKKAL